MKIKGYISQRVCLSLSSLLLASGRAVKVDLKRILSFYVLFVAKYLDNLESFFKLYLNMSEKALKKQPTNKQD